MQEKAEVNGQGSQQVDYSEKAEDILAGLLEAIDACQIFQRKEQGEQIFQHPQHQIGRVGKNVHAFQNDQQYAENNAADEDDVEKFALAGIRLEDDGIDSLFKLVVVQEVVPAPAEG